MVFLRVASHLQSTGSDSESLLRDGLPLVVGESVTPVFWCRGVGFAEMEEERCILSWRVAEVANSNQVLVPQSPWW